MTEKKNNYNHINVTELNALLKDINLVLKWWLSEVEIRTDSATVLSWVNPTLEKSRRIWTEGAGEIMVK